MGPKEDFELCAAAVAAYVLGAKLIRQDTADAHQTRDFDLVLPDNSREPLEITSSVDQPALETWRRFRGPLTMEAPSLRRHWTLDMRAVGHNAAGKDVPRDVRRLQSKIEPALAALEAAGHERIDLAAFMRDSSLAEPCQTLLELGIDGGGSYSVEPGGTPHISYTASVGGFTHPDLVAAAIEREADKPDNKRKLAEPPNATRRHIFVAFHGSTGNAFSAVYHGMKGRLPRLEPPITTAWAWGRPRMGPRDDATKRLGGAQSAARGARRALTMAGRHRRWRLPLTERWLTRHCLPGRALRRPAIPRGFRVRLGCERLATRSSDDRHGPTCERQPARDRGLSRSCTRGKAAATL